MVEELLGEMLAYVLADTLEEMLADKKILVFCLHMAPAYHILGVVRKLDALMA